MMPELMTAMQNATAIAPDLRSGVNEQTIEWLEHEHEALTMQMEAQKLLDEGGSSDVANQVIDDVSATWSEDAESRREQFAHELGFDSYVSLLQCSLPVSSTRRKHWSITAVSDGQWVMWNDEDLRSEAGFRPLHDERPS